MSNDPLALKLRHAAEFFHRYWLETNQKIFYICHAGLTEIAENYAQYTDLVRTGINFLEEIKETAAAITENKRLYLQDPQAAAFKTVEGLAIIMKESILRMPKTPSQIQKEVCTFFEKSGHWSRRYKEIVTEFYHHLPHAVAKEAKLQNNLQ